MSDVDMSTSTQLYVNILIGCCLVNFTTKNLLFTSQMATANEEESDQLESCGV